MPEAARFKYLQLLEAAGEISKLTQHPEFILRGMLGTPIATYTPDSQYKRKDGQWIVEEVKGSKDMWAYKRADYAIFRRWLMADFPKFEFYEVIDGVMSKPRVKYPKEPGCPTKLKK